VNLIAEKANICKNNFMSGWEPYIKQRDTEMKQKFVLFKQSLTTLKQVHNNIVGKVVPKEELEQEGKQQELMKSF
jgi:hypothetical protein